MPPRRFSRFRRQAMLHMLMPRVIRATFLPPPFDTPFLSLLISYAAALMPSPCYDMDIFIVAA